MKNSEVKDEFKAKGLAEAKEGLDIMRLDKEQQYGYNRYLDYLHYKASERLSLRLEAEDTFIADITGLTSGQIEEIRANLPEK